MIPLISAKNKLVAISRITMFYVLGIVMTANLNSKKGEAYIS